MFEEVGPLFTEAALCADLSAGEKERWLEKLGDWQDGIDNYGMDPVLEPAMAALRQGWDHPRLQDAQQGRISDEGIWGDDLPGYADNLTRARLRVLEREERFQEYLNLAEAEA